MEEKLEEMAQKMAMKAAKELKEEWEIGTFSQFCDEGDWDSASDEEIAKKLMPFFVKALSYSGILYKDCKKHVENLKNVNP